MTEIARRTIDELVVRYELEPTLQDVFVEGQFDYDVLSNCFRCHGHADRTVYPIDSVDISPAILSGHDLTDGNKQRVIALARELAQLPEDCRYRCFVDRDLDHWFDLLEETPRLVWSDYCSIELYFLSDNMLQQILMASAKCKITNWNEYFTSLINTLRYLYAARLADRELGWSLKWITADRCLSVNGSRIDFDFSDFIERVLLANGKMGDSNQFRGSVHDWTNRLSGDCRNYIRGHDLTNLLAWSVHHFRGIKAFSSPVAIERILVLLSSQIQALDMVFQ